MFRTLLEKIGRELDKDKISYMIIGGQAVLIYGEPRLTKDIDITLNLTPSEIERIEKICKKLNFSALIKNHREFVKKTFVFPVIDKRTKIRIDFIFSFSDYEKEAMKRVKKVKIGKKYIKFASLEDVIIHKIVSGRPVDIEDARKMILKNPDFDKKYIRKWLRTFNKVLNRNLVEVFEKILKEI